MYLGPLYEDKKMSYRDNANGESLQDQIDGLQERVQHLDGEALTAARMTRNIIFGVLGLTFIIAVPAYGCNREDNRTKLEVARSCPSVASILAVPNEKR